MFVKTLKPFIFLVVVIAMVSLACMGGSNEPAPEPQPAPEEPAAPAEPDQPEEPAPVEEPTEVPQPAAQEFFTEEFDAGNDNWSYFVIDATKDVARFVDDDLEDSSLYTEDGLLVFDLIGEYQWVYAFYDPYEYENVSLEVVAENRGVNDNNISLICRYTEDEGWYEFNIANNGLYWIYHAIVNPDGVVVYSKLADGGSNKVKQGKEVNTYKISCEDRTLTMWINGHETRQIDDNRFVLRGGQVGVSISSFHVLPVNVEIQSVTISEP